MASVMFVSPNERVEGGVAYVCLSVPVKEVMEAWPL